MLLPKLLKWTLEQKKFIESLPGSANEHIRRAIDDYIKKLTPGASASSSERRETK